MRLFPLFADLDGREVLVVGGGDVALRKVEALLGAGARVRLFALDLHPTLQDWLADGRLVRLQGDFDPDWIDGCWLVVAATDDADFNARLAAEAGRRRRLANIVDDAALSTFQVPAIVDRSPLLVAISSAGAAPMLARRVREQLEATLDASLGPLADLFARHREAIRAALPDLAQRRRWFESVLDGRIPALLRERRMDEAEAALAAGLAADAPAATGSVALVGVGPGDPSLLTLHALRAMHRVDRLFYDEAVPPDLRALARRDAHVEILSGAARAKVVDAALRGERVVVLAPGDAFRRGERTGWADAVRAAGLPCEVVAGIVAD